MTRLTTLKARPTPATNTNTANTNTAAAAAKTAARKLASQGQKPRRPSAGAVEWVALEPADPRRGTPHRPHVARAHPRGCAKSDGGGLYTGLTGSAFHVAHQVAEQSSHLGRHRCRRRRGHHCRGHLSTRSRRRRCALLYFSIPPAPPPRITREQRRVAKDMLGPKREPVDTLDSLVLPADLCTERVRGVCVGERTERERENGKGAKRREMPRQKKKK